MNQTDSSTQLYEMDEQIPPGTQRLEDVDKSKLLLCPCPSSDPNQPLRWSNRRKIIHMAILSFYGIMMFAIITAQPPMWEDLHRDLGFSYDDLNNGYATSQGTQTIACIFFVPLAVKYGRRIAYILTSLIMVASCVWFAKMQTYGDLVGANILCGIGSVVNEALFQMTICDLFYVHQRGTATGVFLVMSTIGNYLGPVAVGYICTSPALGWRWAFWICTILMVVVTLIVTFALEESKYESLPQLDSSETYTHSSTNTVHTTEPQEHNEKGLTASDAHIEATVTNMTSLSGPTIDPSIPLKPYSQRMALLTTTKDDGSGSHVLRHLYQPFQILFNFPVVAFAALQYGWAITMLVTLAVVQADLYVKPPYNFSAAGIGLMNIPPAIGSTLGSLFGGLLVDRFIVSYARRRRGGLYEPETRLYLFPIPVVLGMCLGALLFGLTIARGESWPVNAVGAGLVGFGFAACGDMALCYLQDCYQGMLGDALVAVVFVRNGVATAFIFALPVFMRNVGVYGMFVVLSCVALVMGGLCVPFLIWGRRWRTKLAERYYLFCGRQG